MAKGWKGYANEKNETVPDARYKHYPNATQRDYTEPVWVTPLIEGEPVPGDRMIHDGTDVVTVVAVPYDSGEPGITQRTTVIRQESGHTLEAYLWELTPLPEKKRYRVDLSSEPWDWVTVEATDRDDLRDKLAALADDAEVVG